jgi:hypothetical protein
MLILFLGRSPDVPLFYDVIMSMSCAEAYRASLPKPVRDPDESLLRVRLEAGILPYRERVFMVSDGVFGMDVDFYERASKDCDPELTDLTRHFPNRAVLKRA